MVIRIPKNRLTRTTGMITEYTTFEQPVATNPNPIALPEGRLITIGDLDMYMTADERQELLTALQLQEVPPSNR